MQFRLDRFYRINRRALIWLALFGLIWILRDFFALVFVTFLLVSFTLPVINYFQRETRIPRTVIASVLYAAILGGLAGFVYYAVPKVTEEAFTAVNELQQIETRILALKNELVRKNEALKPLFRNLQLDQNIPKFRQELSREIAPILQKSAQVIMAVITTTLLSWLFAFLIVLDLSRLTEELRRLERSRLHDFYEETAEPVVRFFSVIAQAFRAQAMIAVTNTLLTFIGYWWLGLPQIGLLTIIVFFFSFIPVLGVFISTTPAVLVALNMANGLEKAVGVVALVSLIHLVEAYILNPFIYGKHLKLNPVLVLLILFVGHHFFGVWGMLLGVPVAYYFLYYVFGVPREEEAEAGVLAAGAPAGIRVQEPEPRPAGRDDEDVREGRPSESGAHS